MTAVITEKISNAEEIIEKTLANKNKTLEALNTQVNQYSASLKETNKMLTNADIGLKR